MRFQNFFITKDAPSFSVRTEFYAGIINFLTAGYIIVVNPDILSQAGMPKDALITVTCVASALGCFFMAFIGKVPVLMAPGMGLNAFFTYTLCIREGIPWDVALGIVFLSGVLFIILTVTGLRTHILNAIPRDLRYAIPVGIGLFIAFIGLKNMGVIIDHPVTLVALGPLSKTVLLGLCGLALHLALESRGYRGTLLPIMIGLTIFVVIIGWIHPPAQILGAPPGMGPTFFKMDVIQALKPMYWMAIFAFLYVALFDSLGTLTAISYQAGLNVGDKIPRLDKMLMADALGATSGAVLGTSTVTAYIESGAGVATGGRTGFTAFFTGILFLIAPFFSGFLTVIPPYVTAIALIIVGYYMMQHVKDINWKEWETGVPAFLTILFMPLTYSISTGLCFGFISYVFLVVVRGQWKKLNVTLVLIGILSVLYLVLQTRSFMNGA